MGKRYMSEKYLGIPIGVYDSPQNQEQKKLYIDHYRNNIVVFGGPMTGKTTFVKTFLLRLQSVGEKKPKENVYIIDFGGNIGDYSRLRNVCACFGASNEEDIKRIFKEIEKRIDTNVEKLGSNSYYSMAETKIDICPDHITLIIENVNTFLADDRYSTYQDVLLKLCREGLSKGLTVLMTANELVGMSRLTANCGKKVVYDMPADNYYDIFNMKVYKPMKIPGRGMVNIDSGVFEFQTFLPFYDEDKELPIYIEKYNNDSNAQRMLSFDKKLTAENIRKYCCNIEKKVDSYKEIILGLDYYEHDPVCVDINENRSLAIYGKRKFGKTNLLSVIIKGIQKIKDDVRFVFLDDGRNELENIYNRIINERGYEAVYIKDIKGIIKYLSENGYGIPNENDRGITGYLPKGMMNAFVGAFSEIDDVKKKTEDFEKKVPFTVFILQNKALYQGSPDSKYLMNIVFPEMISKAEEKGYLFIYSDVKIISDADTRGNFNNSISRAFLLDSIGDYVSEKGSKSVFGEMDAKELKSEYARCSLGDGYSYDIDADILKKVKFLEAN